MAKLPPKKSEESTGDWLNTYADMVTLLLTFFVLLFACSNLDETKLQFIFQAFKSRGRFINQIVAQQEMDPNATESAGVSNSAQPGGEGEMPQSYEELYSYLADYIDENALSESIAIEDGASHFTIRFDNSVFFDGDSYMLKPAGRELLNDIIPMLRAIDPMVARMRIIGHTAKAFSNENDFRLSSLRACSVQLHLSNNNAIDETKYWVEGAGPNDPVGDNNTAEGRSQNRRVEITLIKNELDLTSSAVLQDIVDAYGVPNQKFDPNDQTLPPDKLPEGSAGWILGVINDKFEGTVENVGSIGPGAVDFSQFIVGTETDSGSDDDEE